MDKEKFMEFIYGDEKRIFVNTALGCKANCKYCYLPDVKKEKGISYITSETAIESVENNSCFVKGERGTVISIGCYSECMDKRNVIETKNILEHFLPMGNYIQLATKQRITDDIIDVILKKRTFQEQICIYVSMPTISGIPELEEGTAPFEARIDNIIKCRTHGIVVALYIKPFLEHRTVVDKDKYIELVEKYCIPTIIGGYLSVKNSAKKADVGEELLYEQEQSCLYKKFSSEFEERGLNFTHSIEFIEYLRRMKKDTNDRRTD